MKRRILFYRSGKNNYSVAALKGTVEIGTGRTVVSTAPRAPLPVPRLGDWQIVSFGPGYKTGLRSLDEDADLTVLAFSFMSIDVPGITKALEELKARRPEGARWIFIAGGPHASATPESTLAMGFDHVFVGEGEVTLLEFLARTEGGQTSPSIIKPDHGPLDLDQFLSFAPEQNMLAPIELGRGCPFTCKFCHIPFIQGRKMRHRSVESVLEHVRIALKRGRIRTWFITSDAFAYGSKYGEQGDPEVCERMLRGCREEGMEQLFWGGFPSEVRPDHVKEELLELVVRYCANKTIVLGAQSGSESVLKGIARGHGSAVILTAVQRIRAFGLMPHVDFMFGLPGETHEDRLRSLDMIDTITSDYAGKVHMHYFMPHPGTPFAEATPVPVEDSVLARIESLTGENKVDGFWRRQRREAARSNPDVLGSSEGP